MELLTKFENNGSLQKTSIFFRIGKIYYSTYSYSESCLDFALSKQSSVYLIEPPPDFVNWEENEKSLVAHTHTHARFLCVFYISWQTRYHIQRVYESGWKSLTSSGNPRVLLLHYYLALSRLLWIHIFAAKRDREKKIGRKGAKREFQLWFQLRF